MSQRVLVIDDEPLRRASLLIELGEAGWQAREAADAHSARSELDAAAFDAIVLNTRLPDMHGLDLLPHIRLVHPDTPVVVTAPGPTAADAVKAMKRGACDFLGKPYDTDRLMIALNAALAARPEGLRDEAAGGALHDLRTHSPHLAAVFNALQREAAAHARVLLSGERGVGKRRVIAAIHQLRFGETRSLAVFGANELDATLAQLNGAFGGRRAKGVLLADVERLTLQQQEQLLSVLSHTDRDSLPALFSSTTRDPTALEREHRLLPALRYALADLEFAIPPLRERRADIPHLAELMLRKLRGPGVQPRITPAGLDELIHRPWPGNIPELESVLRRAAALAPADAPLSVEHLRLLGHGDMSVEQTAAAELFEDERIGLNEALAEVERRMIIMALELCEHNQARAAKRLAIPRTTLRDKIAKYNL